ncbi:MAG: hypothetical protein IID35_06650 [Planctomycetes bacterium]|nr:hypothetical protein [Planctomycetota bacterium]
MHVSGELRAPDEVYDRVVRDLQHIRDTYPVLTDVVDGPDYAFDQLIVRLEPPDPWVGYEDMNTFYQVVEDRVLSASLEIHVLTFCDNLNARVLATVYETLPEVLYAEPGWSTGFPDRISVEELGETYRYTFRDGYNCFDGCGCFRTWVIDVEYDGALTLVSYSEDDNSSCFVEETACCLSSGVCGATNITSCLDLDGTPLEFGTPCASTSPSGCQVTIPAVSQWGMVAMMLLVLTAGTLMCMRHARVRVV